MTDKYFWFLQPSTQLNNYDTAFGYAFAGIFAAGILLALAAYFVKHPINIKALAKWRNLLLNIGGLGLLWFAFRYENTPVFAKRFWVAVIAIVGLVRLFYVLKYTALRFSKEKAEFEAESLRNKYIPQRKK